ncbi:MAG TPA: hypothetical protein VK934_08715 [Fimbriimonas sp.]|nr:hypothetical protein [Fimbriimonas sp.]
MRLGIALLFLASTSLVAAQELRLRPGTRIRLTVQRTLSTHPRGGVLGVVGVKPITREDTLVVYEVVDDVYDEDGNLVIPAGAPATGTVIDSQVGGGLKPHAPRLAVTVERVMSGDGEFIPLRFEKQHEGKWAYVFNRGETGSYVNRFKSNAVAQVFARPEHSEAAREFFGLIVRGEIGRMVREPKKALKLRYLAEQSGLPILARFLQDGTIFRVAALIADIQSGNFILHGLADARKLLDAYRLMDEAWRAGDQLLDWLGGRIKAPQIVVPAGFPVDAIVSAN